MNPEPQAHATDLCACHWTLWRLSSPLNPCKFKFNESSNEWFWGKGKTSLWKKTSNIIQHVHFKFHIMFPQQNSCKNNVSKVCRHFLRLKFAPQKVHLRMVKAIQVASCCWKSSKTSGFAHGPWVLGSARRHPWSWTGWVPPPKLGGFGVDVAFRISELKEAFFGLEAMFKLWGV